MSQVLLTGASGFIGSHIVEHFLAKTDWNLVCPVSYRHMGCPLRVQHFDPKRVKLFHHDLKGPFTDREIEWLGSIDYIINCASESHVDRSILFPSEFISNNVELVLNMLEYARKVKPKAFIQISTDEVYGDAPDGTLHREWEAIRPSNPYSASKAAQEAICFSYWRTYSVPVIITNTMNNFGERQDPEKFVPKVIRSVWRGDEVTIHGTPESIGSRFYLHARNHADAILHLLVNTSPALFPLRDRCDKYNVVGEREINNLDMAYMIAHLEGKELKFNFEDFHTTRPGHDKRYALDGTKLDSIGWKPPLSIEESLARTITWTLRNQEWLI